MPADFSDGFLDVTYVFNPPEDVNVGALMRWLMDPSLQVRSLHMLSSSRLLHVASC